MVADTTTTTIYRDAFPTLGEAFAFISDTVGGVGGSTVQILVGSSKWPDPSRRYRVTVAVDDR